MNFHVADWYVDVDANRIQSGEQDIKLESKVMTLLVYLAQHQGDVISREQLEADVWVDRVISYDALTSCITRLRKVLGDDSRQPAYIETVPKKGYRLIAPVRWTEQTQMPATESAMPLTSDVNSGTQASSIQANSKKSIRRVFLAGMLLVLAVAAMIIISSPPETSDSIGELSDTPSIVVLPFDNLSNEAAQLYFSDGITADINIALSKLSGLLVVAAPSVLAENKEQGLTGADSQRLARYTLTGSVQRAGNQLRVNVMLIDNRTRHQLWAESYDREITAVFEVQDDITAKIVSTLSIKLTEEEKKRVANRYTNSIEAYDQFLRGQALYTQHTSNEILLAREHLQQAIKLDPNFARAYSALSLTYVDEYRYQWFNSTDEPLLKTLALAEKAVSIDSTLPQAYWALAYAQLQLHRYDQAREAVASSLSVLPNYADGYAILALIDIYSGDPAQGLKMIRRAMSLNPDYPAQYLSVLGQAYYYLADYDSAVTTFHDAIDKNFSLLTAQIMLTAALSHAGLAEEATWTAAQLHSLSPDFSLEDVARVFPIKDDMQRRELIEQLGKAGIK
jgi:TolB-like protein/DNA-binding winged helix-turn-helix (wHTH) protein/Tfp pilus assembly protein PilF